MVWLLPLAFAAPGGEQDSTTSGYRVPCMHKPQSGVAPPHGFQLSSSTGLQHKADCLNWMTRGRVKSEHEPEQQEMLERRSKTGTWTRKRGLMPCFFCRPCANSSKTRMKPAPIAFRFASGSTTPCSRWKDAAQRQALVAIRTGWSRRRWVSAWPLRSHPPAASNVTGGVAAAAPRVRRDIRHCSEGCRWYREVHLERGLHVGGIDQQRHASNSASIGCSLEFILNHHKRGCRTLRVAIMVAESSTMVTGRCRWSLNVFITRSASCKVREQCALSV